MTTMAKPPEKPEGSPPQGAPTDSTPAKSQSRVSPRTPRHHPRAVAPGWAILLTSPNGLVRRRVVLTLQAAVAARERAEMRGQHVDLVLVELVPVPPPKPPRRKARKP